MSATKFQNSKYNVSLLNTLKTDKDSKTHIVTKNIPFLLMVSQKNTTAAATSAFHGLKKENISIKLVYENDLENEVNTLKTNPLDCNIYIKDQSVTVETRIQTLSSKHENNLFRIIIVIDGKPLFSESIRCVSKITSSVVNTTTTTTTTTTTNNNTLKTQTHIQKLKQQTQQQPQQQQQHVTVKKSATTNIRPITELSKTIRKLKKLRQNDKNLISLLYQQNKLITTQLNSVTTIVNSLVSQHNKNSNSNSDNNNYNSNNNNNNININNDDNNMFYQQESPISNTYSQSSPPTPFVVYSSQESNLSNFDEVKQEQVNYQFPTIDTDVLKSISTDESCYSYQSDVSSFTGDYQQQQQESIGNYNQSACFVNSNNNSSIIEAVSSINRNEVRLIDNQLKSSSSSLNSVDTQATMIDETMYSHPSSTFTFGLDFNLLGSQNNFNSNRLENQVM